MTRRNRRNRHRVENETQSNTPTPKKVVLDFSFDSVWISTKHKKFTNYLKNDDEFFKMNKIIFKDILPAINRVDFNNVQSFLASIKVQGLPHSHVVDDAHHSFAKEILVRIMREKGLGIEEASSFANQNLDGEKLYQIGLQSVRLFGYFKENIFTVLFIDYHHLVYPSEKHNETDYSSFTMCPIQRGS